MTGEIYPHVLKYIVTRLEKPPKKKGQSKPYMHPVTPSEALSVIRYYCKHILTDNCYRVERKGHLCPQRAILSLTSATLCVYATGLTKPLSG